MDKLNALKIFLATLDQGSFGRAATTLGMDPSTVSKAINRLEQELQCQLFFRSTRKLQVTESGANYALTVRRLLAELGDCEDQLLLDNQEPKGELTVNLPVSYGRLYVLPVLGEFAQQYPLINLNITFSDEYIDIIEQGIDISIRTGTVADSRLVMRKLSPLDFLICASPEYLSRHKIQKVDQLMQHKWALFRFKQTGKLMPITIQHFDGSMVQEVPKSYYLVDDGEALVELCSQGLGLIQAPHFLLKDALKSGRLISLMPVYSPESWGAFILYPKRRFLPQKVQVFIDYLIQQTQAKGEESGHTWAREIEPILTD